VRAPANLVLNHITARGEREAAPLLDDGGASSTESSTPLVDDLLENLSQVRQKGKLKNVPFEFNPLDHLVQGNAPSDKYRPPPFAEKQVNALPLKVSEGSTCSPTRTGSSRLLQQPCSPNSHQVSPPKAAKVGCGAGRCRAADRPGFVNPVCVEHLSIEIARRTRAASFDRFPTHFSGPGRQKRRMRAGLGSVRSCRKSSRGRTRPSSVPEPSFLAAGPLRRGCADRPSDGGAGNRPPA